MRIGTKILLLMLLLTVGLSATVSWIVTYNVTTYETERANDQISLAIYRYLRHLEDRHGQISHIVQALLEAPEQRSWLQAADDPANPAAREQLRQEVLGRDVQAELTSGDGTPVFHVLLNQASEPIVVTAGKDRVLADAIASNEIHWPLDEVLRSQSKPVIHYVSAPGGLFLAMGVPLRTQLSEPPTHAYFVGFRIDDDWVRRQLLAERLTTESTGAALEAWFVVGGRIVGRASSDPDDPRVRAFAADTPIHQVQGPAHAVAGARANRIEFDAAGERFLGQSFDLDPTDASAGRLVLASSMNQALAPLRRLQREILWIVLAACALAILACRGIASMISRPIRELADGTRRIAAGRFDSPVRIRRRDELGTLAESFNQMSQGLKERDALREEHVKIERDLAVARKIQLDVLPRDLPPCPGYDMAAFSLPAEQTGGDIYDLVSVALDPEGDPAGRSIVVLLADATGHGIGPALSVTQVRSMLRIGLRLGASLENIFAQINRQLCHDLGAERFVTAFMGLLDFSGNRVDYHSAGQGPLLHFHSADRHFQWLNASMLPLGVMDDPLSSGAHRFDIEPGDLIVLLTDGVYEFQNPEREQIGRERIADVILRHHEQSAREILDAILAATREFARGAPQLDDMTGLIIRRLPA